ncbi:MAG TPA: tetratricopeptide repeat protein [Thermomicrobiales bacterium]|nr:tetratricopeptide repeat protein [Thermomicrobiales bacterium]
MSSAPEARTTLEPTPIRPSTGRQHLTALPRPLTSFIGREHETEAVVALLADPRIRLVTLTGPGGVGKTRLSIHLAERVASGYPSGVWFVSLASIQDSELVAGAIAQVVAPPNAGQQTAEEQITAALQAGRALLILDNFEHLLGAAPLVGRLLTACPMLTILATSRAHLQVSGEHAFAVPPLDVPDAGSGSLGEHDAVRLFAERATNTSLVPDSKRFDVIAAICRRLDGLPLAIELAAAWVGVLPLTQLLDRLNARLPMLTGGRCDSPTRHQTMRDSIAWSYDLLSPDEQSVFRRASVFVGGFCLEAIEEVAADAVDRAEVLGHVRSLVEKSLIRPVPVADVPRYLMLETIREFAMEQLDQAGEVEETRAAHGEWCAGFAERFSIEVTGPDLAKWTAWGEAELDNVRLALDHADARGDAGSAVRLAGGIGWLWSPGRLQEGRARLERVLSMPGTDPSPRCFATGLLCAGGIEHWLNEYDAATAWYIRAEEVCRASGDGTQLAIALRGIGSVAIDTGDPETATRLLTESRKRSREIGSAWDVAYTTHLLGITAFVSGDIETAFDCHGEALAEFRGLSDHGYVLTSLEPYGRTALLLGKRKVARNAFLEMLELSGGDSWNTARAIRGLGVVAAAEGDARRAARLMGAATRVLDAIGTPERPSIGDYYAQLRDEVRRSLGEEAFGLEWEAGSALTLEMAIEDARRLRAELSGTSVSDGEAELGLTRREIEVLRLVREGLTDREISERLYISRRTVSKHVESILSKLNVDSRRAAALTVLANT